MQTLKDKYLTYGTIVKIVHEGTTHYLRVLHEVVYCKDWSIRTKNITDDLVYQPNPSYDIVELFHPLKENNFNLDPGESKWRKGQLEPILINNYEVKFEKDFIKVGCTTVTRAQIKEIAEHYFYLEDNRPTK